MKDIYEDIKKFFLFFIEIRVTNSSFNLVHSDDEPDDEPALEELNLTRLLKAWSVANFDPGTPRPYQAIKVHPPTAATYKTPA